MGFDPMYGAEEVELLLAGSALMFNLLEEATALPSCGATLENTDCEGAIWELGLAKVVVLIPCF